MKSEPLIGISRKVLLTIEKEFIILYYIILPWCTQLRDTSVRLASVSIFLEHWKAQISTLLRAFRVCLMLPVFCDWDKSWSADRSHERDFAVEVPWNSIGSVDRVSESDANEPDYDFYSDIWNDPRHLFGILVNRLISNFILPITSHH